ncbi:MAG: hypothetical protein WCJ30_12180 [Deltaproteobacteria bacterium]
MKARIVIATVSLATSLAAGSALAQNAGPDVIFLAPRTPEGGVYGTASSSSPPPASSPAPLASPAPSAEPSSGSPPPASEPLPPPPPTMTVEQAPLPYGLAALTGTLAPAPLSPRALLLRERLRLLDTSLPPLAESSRRQRITSGVIQMATGTLVGALGFLFPAGGSGAQDLRPWLWTFGGVAIVTGVLDLAWVPARERLTAQYMQMPYTTARQRRARAVFGEHALEDMAADGSRRRILGAVSGAVLPVALLGVMYREPIFNGTPYLVGTFDYVIIGFAAVGVITSLIGLFSRSPEERLRELYWQQIHMREAELAMPQ